MIAHDSDVVPLGNYVKVEYNEPNQFICQSLLYLDGQSNAKVRLIDNRICVRDKIIREYKRKSKTKLRSDKYTRSIPRK